MSTTTGGSIPLPKGYNVGDRIVTNKVYARIAPLAPGPHHGTITGGSRSANGPVKILFDDYKYPIALSLNLFEVVRGDE